METTRQGMLNFNPRIPLGMRRFGKYKITVKWLVFQSTHPIRDATWMGKYLTSVNGDFNPRIPLGMRLYRLPADTCARRYFNPRIPLGMRQS